VQEPARLKKGQTIPGLTIAPPLFEPGGKIIGKATVGMPQFATFVGYIALDLLGISPRRYME
jgi:hypothetical protein